MARLGPEYVGKLPPGAAEALAQSLADYRKAAKDGLIKGIKILPGPGCPVSEAQQDAIYKVSNVPTLPLKGCTRSPCCGCDYCPVMD